MLNMRCAGVLLRASQEYEELFHERIPTYRISLHLPAVIIIKAEKAFIFAVHFNNYVSHLMIAC